MLKKPLQDLARPTKKRYNLAIDFGPNLKADLSHPYQDGASCD
jgi:hypothetical protein